MNNSYTNCKTLIVDIFENIIAIIIKEETEELYYTNNYNILRKIAKIAETAMSHN
jgi:hypothetical protein